VAKAISGWSEIREKSITDIDKEIQKQSEDIADAKLTKLVQWSMQSSSCPDSGQEK